MSQNKMIQFYQAFQVLNASEMTRHYHEEVVFSDPVFSNLNATEVKAMWEMLIERSNGELKVDFHSVTGNENQAKCIWEARYYFSNNPVHNIIHSTMKFKDGLIIDHKDHFNFWKWSSMALGTTGKLIGWSPFLKAKVRGTAIRSLTKYLEKVSDNQ